MDEINCENCVGLQKIRCDSEMRTNNFVANMFVGASLKAESQIRRIGDIQSDQLADEMLDDTAAMIAANRDSLVETLVSIGCGLNKDQMIEKVSNLGQ